MALKQFKVGETAKIDITVEENGTPIVLTGADDVQVTLKVQNPQTGAETEAYKYKFSPGGGWGQSEILSASVARVFVDSTESVNFNRGLVNAYVSVLQADADFPSGQDKQTYGPFLVAKIS